MAIFNGKIHYKWQFSIAMLVHQRVATTFIHIHGLLSSLFTSCVGVCLALLYANVTSAMRKPKVFGISNDSSMRSCFSRRWINLGRPGKAGLWPAQFTGIYESTKTSFHWDDTEKHGETMGCWVHSLFSSKPIECSFQKLIMVETPSAKTCQQTKHLMWNI